MASDAGKGTEGIGPDDVAWSGVEGDLDERVEQSYLEASLPLAAMREVLIAIIQNHPRSDRASVGTRLDEAMLALFGDTFHHNRGFIPGRENGINQRGPKENPEDHRILELIAERYFLQHFGFDGPPRSITSICRKAAEDLQHASREEVTAITDADVRRLKEKFERHKDLLLVRYSHRAELNAERYAALIQKILQDLNELGVVATRRR